VALLLLDKLTTSFMAMKATAFAFLMTAPLSLRRVRVDVLASDTTAILLALHMPLNVLSVFPSNAMT
jgi:phage-related minor tail protein